MTAAAYALALMVFVVDQLVKRWIIDGLALEARGTIPLNPLLSLTWVENRGVSMGLFTADSDVGRWLLVGLTGLIAAVVAVWIGREKGRPERIALGLILGGALGNIVDRIRFGYVVDFIHLHLGQWSFYVFNVADAAITLGVAILVVRALIGRSAGRQESSDHA
jgi:signal peptidase II